MKNLSRIDEPTDLLTKEYLELKLSEFFGGGNNLVAIKDMERGYLGVGKQTKIDPPANPNNEFTTAYIPVDTNVYTFQMWVTADLATAWWGYQLFSESFEPLTFRPGWHIEGNGEKYVASQITVTPETKYIRVSFRKINDGKIKLERGNVGTPYTVNMQDVFNLVN